MTNADKYTYLDDELDAPRKVAIRKMRPQGSLTNLHVFNTTVKQGATNRYNTLARKLNLKGL